MGLCDVLPYFRENLCNAGYEEWTVELDSENPPNSIADKVFKLDVGNITASPARHTSFNFIFPVELIMYFKTFNKPIQGRDDALQEIDEVMGLLLDVEKRYGASLKSIVPTSVLLEAIDQTNDNILKVTIDFDVNLELEYRQT